MKQVFAVVALILAVFAGYIFFTTPRSAELVTLGADPQRLEMIRLAPPEARDIFVLPRAAGVYRALENHPIASSWLPLIDRDRDTRMLPLLLGRADVVAWQENRRIALIANPDPLRRLFARLYLAVATDRRLELENGLLFIGTEPRTAAGADGLPTDQRGHLFVIHRPGDAAFPPIPRPALSAVTLQDSGIRILTSSAAPASRVAPLPLATYPSNAMLAAVAVATPEWLDRLGNLVPQNVTTLLHDGALYAVYRVDSDNLIPRLYGVVVVPGGSAGEVDQVLSTINLGPFGSAEERRQFRGVEIVRRSGLGTVMEYATSAGKLLVSFDRSSIERYLLDTQLPSPFPPERTVWFATVQPQQLYGAVDELRDRQELSLLAPELHRSIDQTAEWLRYVRGASRLEMARLAGPDGETFVLNLSK